MQSTIRECCIILCLFFLPIGASATQTIVLSDGVFANGAWEAGPNGGTSNTTVITSQQVLSGGNPNEYWRFSFSASDSKTSSFLQTYLNRSASFDPSTLGRITSISGGFQQNLLSFSGISDVFDTYLAIRQNNSVYVTPGAYGLENTGPGWYGNDNLYSGSSVSDPLGWVLIDGSGPSRPVFGVTGSNIEFGIAVGSYFSDGSGQFVGGIDNWRFNIGYMPLPEPASGIAVITFLAISCRRSRRPVSFG